MWFLAGCDYPSSYGSRGPVQDFVRARIGDEEVPGVLPCFWYTNKAAHPDRFGDCGPVSF
jgi:hypothetical protein